MTEDVVRDKAKEILKLNVISPDTQSGAGQITSFKNLDVNSNKKPDGWYLPPKNKNASAIILEAKCSDASLDDDRWKDEILRNCEIVFLIMNFKALTLDIPERLFIKMFWAFFITMSLYDISCFMSMPTVMLFSEKNRTTILKNYRIKNTMLAMVTTAAKFMQFLLINKKYIQQLKL